MKFVLTPALKHGSAGEISKQSAEPRTVYDYIRHSSGPDVWMWNLEHNKVCVCQDRCILYMGSLQDPEDPLHVSYNKSRSQGSIRVSHALQHGNWTTLEILWSHRTQTITVQLLLWFSSLHQTGNNLQEDLTTRGSEPVESDLRPLNIDASYTWKKAISREDWHSIVDMAILKKSMLWRQTEREREREREKQREPGTLLLSTLVRCEDNVKTVKSLTYLATLTVTAVSCIAPPTGWPRAHHSSKCGFQPYDNVNRKVLSSRLNSAAEWHSFKSVGTWIHTSGAAIENIRSPTFSLACEQRSRHESLLQDMIYTKCLAHAGSWWIVAIYCTNCSDPNAKK